MRYASNKREYVFRLLLDAGIPYEEAEQIAGELWLRLAAVRHGAG